MNRGHCHRGVIVVEALNIISLSGLAVFRVLAGLEMSPSAGTNDRVPVHHDLFSVLLLADAAEEGSNFPFHGPVQNQIHTGSSQTEIVINGQGQRSLLAGGDLRASGE